MRRSNRCYSRSEEVWRAEQRSTAWQESVHMPIACCEQTHSCRSRLIWQCLLLLAGMCCWRCEQCGLWDFPRASMRCACYRKSWHHWWKVELNAIELLDFVCSEGFMKHKSVGQKVTGDVRKKPTKETSGSCPFFTVKPSETKWLWWKDQDPDTEFFRTTLSFMACVDLQEQCHSVIYMYCAWRSTQVLKL